MHETPKALTNEPYQAQLKPAEPLQPESDLPEKLLRAMRRAVPLEQWDSTEDHLKRAFNLRLERSDDAADLWASRETDAYNHYANARLRRRTLALISKAAAALLTAAAYIASKTLRGD
jgi:hypothetical protein